jgi:hypothetical protein
MQQPLLGVPLALFCCQLLSLLFYIFALCSYKMPMLSACIPLLLLPLTLQQGAPPPAIVFHDHNFDQLIAGAFGDLHRWHETHAVVYSV